MELKFCYMKNHTTCKVPRQRGECANDDGSFELISESRDLNFRIFCIFGSKSDFSDG